EVGIGMLGDEARRASCDGHDVDTGFRHAGCGAADGELLAIGREAVAAVAVGRIADVEGLRRAALGGDGDDFAILIEDEGFAVVAPIWRLSPVARARSSN